MGVGLVTLLLVVLADRRGSARSLGAEWPPEAGAWYLARSAGLAVGSVMVLVGLRRQVIGALDARPGAGVGRFELGVALLGALLAIVPATLVVLDPAELSALVREDGAVESLSAGLAFLAALFYGLAALGTRFRRSVPDHVAATALLVLASGACLLLALEEISWFQRILDVESPEFMVNRNAQKELNLHNLATDFTGNAYFVGGFVFCTSLPYLFADRALPAGLSWLEPLVPGRSVLLAAATSAAVVYEMWNILWIQATFWLTLVALFDVGGDRSARFVGRSVLIVAALVAGTFLLFGDGMVRSWDDTEVRELILPFGLAVAGFEVIGRQRDTVLGR